MNLSLRKFAYKRVRNSIENLHLSFMPRPNNEGERASPERIRVKVQLSLYWVWIRIEYRLQHPLEWVQVEEMIKATMVQMGLFKVALVQFKSDKEDIP